MQVDYQLLDNLNAKLRIDVSRQDYEQKYKTALHDYRKKASFKGFRKGKTPVGYLEKLFGQEVLTKTITDMWMEAVNKYLEEHKVPYIGQPLPAQDQPAVHFDPKELADNYSYTFDIGLLPEFEVKGLDQEIEWYDVPVTEEQIEDEWKSLLKRKGTYEDVESIEEGDRVNLRFREMEGLGPKLDGKEHSRLVNLEMISEEVRKELIGKKMGDTIHFEADRFMAKGDAQLFKRYYLNITDEQEQIADKIEAQVMDITRLKEAEPNEEFFNSVFDPGTVHSEDEAKVVISRALKQRNDAQSDAHLRHMLEHQLMDANPIELPLDFIARLIDSNKEGDKETGSPETQANAFRWHFIKEKLVREFDINATQEEVMRAAADRIYNQFGGYLPYDRMKEMLNRYLSDKESMDQVRSSVLDTKLFYILKDKVPVVKKEISPEEFEKMQHEHRHEH